MNPNAADTAEQLTIIRAFVAAHGVVIQALARSAPNKDVLRTAINDAFGALERVHSFADRKFGTDEVFDEAYRGALNQILATLKTPSAACRI